VKGVFGTLVPRSRPGPEQSGGRRNQSYHFSRRNVGRGRWWCGGGGGWGGVGWGVGENPSGSANGRKGVRQSTRRKEECSRADEERKGGTGRM